MDFFHDILLGARRASAAELRKFGLIFGGIVLALGYFKGPPLECVGLAALALALLFPRALRPIYLAASGIGALLGAVNNRVLLGLIFFFVLLPFSLSLRWFARRDPLARGFDAAAPTYRVFCGERDMVKNKEKVF